MLKVMRSQGMLKAELYKGVNECLRALDRDFADVNVVISHTLKEHGFYNRERLAASRASSFMTAVDAVVKLQRMEKEHSDAVAEQVKAHKDETAELVRKAEAKLAKAAETLESRDKLAAQQQERLLQQSARIAQIQSELELQNLTQNNQLGFKTDRQRLKDRHECSCKTHDG